MIKPNQTVWMAWNGRNKQHFIDKGYIYTKQRDRFEVSVDDLMETSKARITVICDICKEAEYTVSYYSYTKSKEKTHLCKNCHSTKSIIILDCWSCGDEFQTTKMAQKKSKSGNLFCSNSCVGEYNSMIKDKRVERKCSVCDKSYYVKRVHKDTTVACSVSCHNEWQKTYWSIEENLAPKMKRLRDAMRYNRKYGTKETKPERLVREHFESEGFINFVDFFQEEPLLDRYFADFYFPEHRIVIEVYGDYWHANPSVYGEGKKPLNDTQSKAIVRDKERMSNFKNKGYEYIIIWEKDIYKDVRFAVYEAIKETSLNVYPRNDYTQDALNH